MTPIRRAEPGDELAVAHVQNRAWKAGYRGLLPQEYLDGLDVSRRAGGYTFDRSLPEGPVTLLAPADDQPVAGFVTIGRSRDDGLADHAEVWAMYVDPDHWGDGTGRLLIESARDTLRDHHFDRCALWVLEGNSRARRFYERDGWSPDGARRVDIIGSASAAHVRYRRAIA